MSVGRSIVTRPGVQGGQPVVDGTRIPVACIVLEHRHASAIADVLSAYPSLTPEDVTNALDYYAEHRALIDPRIEALKREDDDLDSLVERSNPV